MGLAHPTVWEHRRVGNIDKRGEVRRRARPMPLDLVAVWEDEESPLPLAMAELG